MKAKRRKQRTTSTPLNIVTTKQHTGVLYLGGGTSNNLDQAAQWSSPRGVGWVTTTVPSSSNLTMQSERCDTPEWQGAGQHSKEQTNSIGKLYRRVKNEQQKGGQTAMIGPGGP